jgi:hypothetical protein
MITTLTANEQNKTECFTYTDHFSRQPKVMIYLKPSHVEEEL